MNLRGHLDRGFSLYKTVYFKKMLEGYLEIGDFANQFVLIEKYHQTNNKFACTLEKMILFYGETLGREKYKIMQNKNPFKNHQGRLSPFKKGSVNYSEEAKEKAIKNRSYNTRVEYYLKQGYSLEESKRLLTERQTTFTLEKCIERYGEIEGRKRWKERQIRWQNTLNSKPQEEIDRINSLKGLGAVNYFSDDIEGVLYYIRFYNEYDEFWKIGITSNNASKRLNLSLFEYKNGYKHDILFEKKCDSMMDAYNLEQKILLENSHNRIKINLDSFSTTEAFNIDIFRGNYENI